MSLIERKKLIDHLNACLAESEGGTPITDAVLVAIRCAVEQMPEVDAVPVVRCGECKFGRDTFLDGFVECRILKRELRTDFFCAYGERRADNG